MELSDVARAFIQRASVGRLATVDAGGAPHVIPICFVLLDGRVYSVIDEKPKRTTRLQRLRNLEANPRVALVIDRYSDDWSQLAWVMMRGLAEIIEAGRGARRGDRREEHAAAIAALREKYPQYRSMALDDRPVIRLLPDRINAWGLDG